MEPTWHEMTLLPYESVHRLQVLHEFLQLRTFLFVCEASRTVGELTAPNEVSKR